MSRAPFSYPLGRPLDSEAGGAADLQTDIMRFMAILALCLMAIFALVQSLPDAPVAANTEPAEAVEPVETSAAASDTRALEPEPRPVVLTRPAAPKPPRPPEPVAFTRTAPQPVTETTVETPPPAAPAAQAPPATPQPDGFTLRFESDVALSRLVATGQVGFFAIDAGGAQRMSVASSRISFWAAPMPARYHEMDAATVPVAVSQALSRTGRAGRVQRWAVTLPARLTGELERLMQAHSGGALIIGKDGSLRREAS